jgi:hypothetical protein
VETSGEVTGLLLNLGTWRLFAPANKTQLAGFSVRSGAGSAETGLVGWGAISHIQRNAANLPISYGDVKSLYTDKNTDVFACWGALTVEEAC